MDPLESREVKSTKADETAPVVVRSEEELTVTTVRRPVELVRVTRYVVTENKTITVPVRREEIRIERVPLSDTEAASSLGPRPEELDIVLHVEEVVVEKRVVPSERVRVLKERLVRQQTVSEELRKERVAVERIAPISSSDTTADVEPAG